MHNGGDRCYQGISLGNNHQTDTIVAFNSLEGPIRRSNSSELNRNIRIVGNIAAEINAVNSGNSSGCGTGTTAIYNVLTDRVAARCGALQREGWEPVCQQGRPAQLACGNGQVLQAATG